MNYIRRRYYENRQENPGTIWQYLDCIEKVAYHQFQNTSINMEEVFCDDINIRLRENQNDLVLERNTIKNIEQYFILEYRKNLEHPEKYIKEMIDKGVIVGINTFFYDIPNFIWYKKERYKESVHVSMIVGYDENGFWLTDVPEIMITEYLKEPHITRIPYDKMKACLSKQCKVWAFVKKADIFPKCEDLDKIGKNIIEEYSALPYFEDGRIIWKGKQAYERLLYLMRTNDPRIKEMEFCQGEFMATIISGRHDLLKRNIIRRYGGNGDAKDVIQLLAICEKKWKVLANKIFKEILKKGSYTPEEDDFDNIYKSEQKLLECLKFFYEGM